MISDETNQNGNRMRLLHQDSRTNEVKLLPETVDDLWHLYNLIDEGDLVFAVTYRRKEERPDKLREGRTEKIRMRLGIRVKKVEFHESDDRLRLLGTIESGPQDVGEHHTLLLSPMEDISIAKPQWRKLHFERVKRALESSEKPKVFFVAIEDTEAVIASTRDYGVREHATIARSPEGKMYESKSTEGEYLDEIVEKLRQMMSEEPLIVLGPGFQKEALAKRLREKLPETAKRLSVQSTGQAGMAGIHELMKKGIGGKVLEDSRVAKETMLTEKLFSEIAKEGLYAYGEEQVMNAARSGAVDTMLIIDSKVRSAAADELLRLVENTKGQFVIVSSLHEAGRRLESLGGVAAILRFRIG